MVAGWWLGGYGGWVGKCKVFGFDACICVYVCIHIVVFMAADISLSVYIYIYIRGPTNGLFGDFFS